MIRMSRPLVMDWRTLLRELAITFVGVLLALIATAWWGEHQDRKRERAYIAQLRSDLIATRTSLDSAITYNKNGLAADSALLSLMRLGPPFNPDTLGKYLALPWFGTINGTMTLGTARALSQSAEGGVIADPALRVRITNYVALADAAALSNEGYAQVARPLADKLGEYMEQSITPDVAARATTVFRNRSNAPLAGSVIVPLTITRFARDPAFRAVLSNFSAWRSVTNRRLLEVRGATDSLLKRLPHA